jgi:hypothetical protein
VSPGWTTCIVCGGSRAGGTAETGAFSGIKLLDIVQVEKIWRNYKIDDGLIANEVL